MHLGSNVDGSVLPPVVPDGRHVQLRRVVVNLGDQIPDGVAIGADAPADVRRFFRIDSGITLVTSKMRMRMIA